MGKATMRQRLFTTAVTITLAAGCSPFVIQDGGFHVQGLVVDRAGKPVPNVSVKARNVTSVTDQRGCFQIWEITHPYTHEMPFSVTAAGFRSFVGTVTTSSAAKRRFRVSLAAADAEPGVKTTIDTASTEAAIGSCDVTRPGQGSAVPVEPVRKSSSASRPPHPPPWR
jgi:hypothetical protein